MTSELAKYRLQKIYCMENINIITYIHPTLILKKGCENKPNLKLHNINETPLLMKKRERETAV